MSQRNLRASPSNRARWTRTGWFRTGCCETDEDDVGRHVVCVQLTAAFLEFSKSRGNDLSTPRPGLPRP